MKKLSFASLCFSVALLFASCTKEGPMGPIGPQGPQGPQGAQGTAGTNGTNGSQGPAGSANVVYSGWTTEALEWADVADAAVPQKEASVSATALTQEVLDRGIVLVYARTADGSVHSLPSTIYSDATTANTFRFSMRVGTIKLNHTKTVGGVFQAPTAEEVRFRYVVVPGGTSDSRISSGAAAGYTAAQLQAMSYDQIVTLFRIPK